MSEEEFEKAIKTFESELKNSIVDVENYDIKSVLKLNENQKLRGLDFFEKIVIEEYKKLPDCYSFSRSNDAEAEFRYAFVNALQELRNAIKGQDTQFTNVRNLVYKHFIVPEEVVSRYSPTNFGLLYYQNGRNIEIGLVSNFAAFLENNKLFDELQNLPIEFRPLNNPSLSVDVRAKISHGVERYRTGVMRDDPHRLDKGGKKIMYAFKRSIEELFDAVINDKETDFKYTVEMFKYLKEQDGVIHEYLTESILDIRNPKLEEALSEYLKGIDYKITKKGPYSAISLSL